MRFNRTKRHKKCAFCTKKLEEVDFEKLEKKVQDRLEISHNWQAREQKDAEDLRARKQL